MKLRLKIPSICFSLLLPIVLHAQLPSNKVKPAVIHYGGDTVRSQRLGLQARIPDGWVGVLPRESEVFVLAPQDNTIGEIYVLVNLKTDLLGQQMLWKTGFELEKGTVLQPDGEITKRGDNILCANGKLTGATASQSSIYAEAKCSPSGYCVVYVAIADQLTIGKVKAGLQSFVDNTWFVAPSNESPYKNFNWKKFLQGKIIMAMNYDDNSKRIDEVDLCADGTFQSRITRTGVFKNQAKGYQGTKGGTWDVKSNIEKATITFTFKSKKLPPIDVVMEGREDEIYVNQVRYFVGQSERCK